MTDRISPTIFRSRYGLAIFSDGGIVLDLETGSYWRLNASAAILCGALECSDDLGEAIERAASRLGISKSTVAHDFGTLGSLLRQPSEREEPTDPFLYAPAPGGRGYEVWQDTTKVLQVDEDLRALRLTAVPAILPLRLYDYVSGIAPKLLSLLGVTALHGASCARDGRALGVCGKSRAGKTTTARTLARHGYDLLTEDLLILDADLSAPAVFTDGEAYVGEWSKRVANELASAPEQPVSFADLLSAARGATRPLDELWFLDAQRRGDRLEIRPLPQTDALVLVIRNQFLGAMDPRAWRRHLAASRAIVASVPAGELAVPDGLDRLDLALASYSSKIAS